VARIRILPSVSLGQIPVKRIIRMPLRPGNAGVRDTLVVLATLVEKGRIDPEVHRRTWQLILPFQPREKRQQVENLFRFVQGQQKRAPREGSVFTGPDPRRQFKWRSDPRGVELIYDARLVLHNKAGDCEELTMLLATMLTIAGFPTEFVVVSRRPDKQFHHIFVRIPFGARALYLDPSIPDPMGSVPSELTRTWLAKTYRNRDGTLDIWEVQPETIRGRVAGPSITFGG